MFASRTVKCMKDVPVEIAQEHTRLSIAFEHYDSIDRGARQMAITSARNIINHLTSSQVMQPFLDLDTQICEQSADPFFQEMSASGGIVAAPRSSKNVRCPFQ